MLVTNLSKISLEYKFSAVFANTVVAKTIIIITMPFCHGCSLLRNYLKAQSWELLKGAVHTIVKAIYVRFPHNYKLVFYQH